MGRRTLINLVFFLAVFGVLMFWAINNIVTFDQIEKPYTISGQFEQAVGVRKDSEVTYLGVHYGRVAAVAREDGFVRITMRIDRDKHLPKGSIARVFRKSAIGEPYIDFAPPEDFEDDGPVIEPGEGDEIALDHTTVPLEFSELLKSASALIDGIDPESATILIHELAVALDGRGQSLHDLTEAADQLTRSFVTKTTELDRLATNNTRLTKVFADHRESLGRSITNLRELADSLRNANGDIAVVLDDGSRLLGMAADLVADDKRNLDCILGNAEDVIDLATSPEQLDNLEFDLENAEEAFGYVWATRDEDADGLWLRVNLLVALENPPLQYVPERDLPSVPAVPACASTLSASSGPRFGSAGPSAPGSPGGPTLPATGGSPVALLALFLSVGAFATWRLRWRTGE